MWTMVWWYRLGLTRNSSTIVLWQSPVLSGGPVSRHISRVSRRMGEGNENLVYPSPTDFKRSLCSKILPALLPFRRKSYYTFSSPLMTHRPRPGLNTRTKSNGIAYMLLKCQCTVDHIDTTATIKLLYTERQKHAKYVTYSAILWHLSWKCPHSSGFHFSNLQYRPFVNVF
jgi:hypothetical protein